MEMNTQVTIVGAGPVGLSMAIGLARMGIQCVVIEKHPSTTNHPKARGVNTRTMEIFKLWGLEKALRQYELPLEAHRFIWLESFQGKELARISAKARPSSASPTSTALISQDWVEHELLVATQQYPGIHCLFDTTMLDFHQDVNGVRTTVCDNTTGKQLIINSKFLIGADGAASPIRKALNIAMEGEDNLGKFCNIYCEMDLGKYVEDRPSVGFMFTRRDLMGTFILAKDGAKKWLIGVRYDGNPALSKESFTDDFCVEFVKRVVGDDSVHVSLINKSFWTMAALVAQTYRQGRVFLAGDAAHRLPPTGGLGMNTGVQDAHNLAWKLALVLQGHAEDTLLNTYYEERAPIAVTNINWSTKNAKRFTTIFTALYEEDYATMNRALEEQNEHLNQIALDIGFHYEQGALIPEQGSFTITKTDQYIPSTFPGSRAPHYVLYRKDKPLSTLDLFDGSFILLSSDSNSTWHEAALTIKTFPLRSYRIGIQGELQDKENQWLKMYEINEMGAVLIRPDGHVAWRSRGEVANADYCLREVLRKMDCVI